MIDRYDQDLLLDYLEGDLDPAQRAQVDRLLTEDPQLASLMASLADDRAQLRAMPLEQTPGDLGFDLMQGLERRMLLDAPQVEPTGPIPIQRGRRLAPPSGGPHWGRIVGLSGMAAALAIAAGLVVYFDAFNPLSQTARDLVQQESAAPAGSADVGSGGLAANIESAETPADDEASALDLNPPRVVRGPQDIESDALLAERARQAIRNGATGGGISAPGHTPSPAEEQRANLEAQANPLPPAITDLQVALTAYAPEQSLHIESDDPEMSRQQLLSWCVDNGVPIVEPQLAGAGEGVPAGLGGIALIIEKEQLDKLILAMNRDRAARSNNQRASIDAADNAYLNQAQPLALADTADDAAQPDADGADPAPSAVVELRVPADLGDAVQTRLNVANTLLYSNRNELALAAQREAEVLRNQRPAVPGAAMIDEAGGLGGLAEGDTAGEHPDAFSDTPGLGDRESAPGEALRGNPRRDGGGRAGSRAGGQGRGGLEEAGDGRNSASAPGNTGDPAADGPGDGTAEADPQTAPNAGPPPMRDPDERPETEEKIEDPSAQPETNAPGAAPAAVPNGERRGNWLLSQVPLAPSTPIWTDLPTAQLVPIFIVRRAIGTDPATLETEPDAAQPEAPADSVAPAEPEEPAAEEVPAEDE